MLIKDRELERLRALLLIDQNDLDRACVEQTDLYDKVADQYTLLCSQRDEADAKLKEVEAEVSLDIRRMFKPEGRGKGDKITEGEVKARVTLDRRVIRAVSEYNLYAKRALRWGALRESYSLRRHMLQELGNLFAAGYWNKASVKGGATGKRLVARVREAQRRRFQPDE